MLLVVEEGVREEICHVMHRYAKLNNKYMKNYNKTKNCLGMDNVSKCLLKVDIDNPKYLHSLHSDLPFLSERMKINKCNKFLCNLYDKELCSSYMSLKTNI